MAVPELSSLELAAMEISREVFEKQCRPRFGNANPEKMDMAFWEWLIQGGAANRSNEGEWQGTGYGPYEARKILGIEDEPKQPADLDISKDRCNAHEAT